MLQLLDVYLEPLASAAAVPAWLLVYLAQPAQPKRTLALLEDLLLQLVELSSKVNVLVFGSVADINLHRLEASSRLPLQLLHHGLQERDALLGHLAELFEVVAFEHELPFLRLLEAHALCECRLDGVVLGFAKSLRGLGHLLLHQFLQLALQLSHLLVLDGCVLLDLAREVTRCALLSSKEDLLHFLDPLDHGVVCTLHLLSVLGGHLHDDFDFSVQLLVDLRLGQP